MEKYDVELLPAAYSDLDEIFNYIMADNPKAAAETLDNIMKSLHNLEDFPNSGAPLTYHWMQKFNFRMVVMDTYVAFYRFIDKKVIIYRVLHSARNYLNLLKESLKF